MEVVLLENCELFPVRALPAWNDLPDLELYMDQVLSLVIRYLGADGKALTASMVNNYVKMGAVPAPRKKRYGRAHLSRLIVICVLKSVLPLGDIQTLLEHGTADSSDEQFYSDFRTQYQAVREELAAVYNGSASVPSLMSAALRAQAEQQIALKFCERL